MMCSANEVMTLAAKAALGAGAPPQQAEQFGRAALVHLIEDRPVSELSGALDALPNGPVMTFPVAFFGVMEQGTSGTAKGTISFGPYPALAQSYAQSLPCRTVGTIVDGGFEVEINLTLPQHIPAVARISLPDDLGDMWRSLAARLLVPESDASRLSGAGAGLTDND